jgi:hypothetical protein
MSLRWAALLASLALGGCFTEATSIATDCQPGAEACPCADDRCDGELTCHEGVCRRPDCREGIELCPCFEGNCFSGLQCIDGTCRTPPGDSTGSGNTSSPLGSTSNVDPTETTSSTSSPQPTGTGAVDDTTSSATTAEDTSSSAEGTSAEETSFGEVDTSPQTCACQGSRSGYQSCFLGDTGFAPLPCPALVDLGSPCDSVDPPITVPGCCADDVTVLYCDLDNIVRGQDCTDAERCL